MSNELEAKLARAKAKVDTYLAPYGGRKLKGQIKVDETLDMYSLAAHCYPDIVLVKSPDIAEAIIAHEWVHVVQGTLEYFRGFLLLYILLAEGLAEFVTKELYPDHVVKYPAGYELVATLVANDPEVIGGLLQLNNLPLIPEDVDTSLASAHVPSYSRDLIARMADRIRDRIRTANEVGIDDSTFVTLGEEVRAWKFILDQRFDGIRDRLDGAIKACLKRSVSWGKRLGSRRHGSDGGHGRRFRVFRASLCFRVPEEDPMTLKVILEEGVDGYIIAECPQIPGCMSQGRTKEEALANIKDAVQACLKVMTEKRRCIA